MLIAGLLALALTVGFQVVSAQRGGAPPPPEVLDYLCVNGYTGVIRDVSSPACQPHESLLTLPDDYPFLACASNYTNVLRHAGNGDADCRGYETAVQMPSQDSEVLFCIMPSTGILKHITTASQCPAGGTVASVGLPPETVADSYAALTHVPIDVPVAGGLLANDTASGGTVSDIDTTDTIGTVTVEPDGRFRYAPAGGFTGTDTFSYTVTNASGGATATVTVEVSGPMIWFVDSEYPGTGTGTGTLDDPFSTSNQISDDGLDPDNPGDFIFLFERATPYSRVRLEAGQTLMGQELDLVAVTAVTAPPFSVLPQTNPSAEAPKIAYSTSAGVVLAPDVTVAGLTVTRTALAGIVGEDFTGDVTLDRVTVSAPGETIPAVELSDIDGTVTVAGSQITGADSESDGGVGLSASAVTALNVIAGTTIAGGTAESDGNRQTGGAGILGQNVDITLDAATVRGGDAVNTYDDEQEGGWTGGHGIALESASLAVNNGSTVAGGAVVFTEDSSDGHRGRGSGGSGIEAANESSVTVNASTVTGGQSDGRMENGIGIDAMNSSITIQDGATVTGGDGGAGGVGSGVNASESTLVVDNASVAGGAETSGDRAGSGIESQRSDTTVRNGATVTGAAGITVTRDGNLTVTGATVSADPDGNGAAISTEDVDVTITGSTMSGGVNDGVDVIPAVAVQSSSEPALATLTNNTLLTDGFLVPSLIVRTYEDDSSICLNASGNSNGAGGPPVGLFILDNRAGVLGISQATVPALREANNGVQVEFRIGLGFGCGQG